MTHLPKSREKFPRNCYAKIFQNGHSQAIRLPKKFRFSGKEVYIKKQNNLIVLIPKKKGWDSLFNSLDKFTDDFMEERIQPPNQDREDLF